MYYNSDHYEQCQDYGRGLPNRACPRFDGDTQDIESVTHMQVWLRNHLIRALNGDAQGRNDDGEFTTEN